MAFFRIPVNQVLYLSSFCRLMTQVGWILLTMKQNRESEIVTSFVSSILEDLNAETAFIL